MKWTSTVSLTTLTKLTTSFTPLTKGKLQQSSSPKLVTSYHNNKDNISCFSSTSKQLYSSVSVINSFKNTTVIEKHFPNGGNVYDKDENARNSNSTSRKKNAECGNKSCTSHERRWLYFYMKVSKIGRNLKKPMKVYYYFLHTNDYLGVCICLCTQMVCI